MGRWVGRWVGEGLLSYKTDLQMFSQSFTKQLLLFQAGVKPKEGMEGPVQPQQPSNGSTLTGKACWSLDVRAATILLTLAGVVILLLLYRMLQLRHRCVAPDHGDLSEYGPWKSLKYQMFFGCRSMRTSTTALVTFQQPLTIGLLNGSAVN